MSSPFLMNSVKSQNNRQGFGMPFSFALYYRHHDADRFHSYHVLFLIATALFLHFTVKNQACSDGNLARSSNLYQVPHKRMQK
jgi:hypothetical protein